MSVVKILVQQNTQISKLIQASNGALAATLIQVRYSKPPSDPRWRQHRAAKVVKHPFQYHFDDMRRQENMEMDEIRSEKRKRERRHTIGSHAEISNFSELGLNTLNIGQVLDEYVPPELDGKASLISKKRGEQLTKRVKEKTASIRSGRLIKKYDEEYSKSKFPIVAHDIYLEVNKLLENHEDNSARLHQLVTPNAILEMTENLELRTLRWEFIKSLDAPRVVNAKAGKLFEQNTFAQVTVRFFTQQKLAIYDQFGRLMYGSEHQPKNVLEFVVFERLLSSDHGRWRMAGKISPDWLPQVHAIYSTYRHDEDPKEGEETVQAQSK